MKVKESLIFLLVIFHCSYAPPVSQDKSKDKDSEIKDDLEEYMEYHRYLKEVVQALESDPHFRERLEKADEEDVRSGKIAEQLDFVNHNVRTKLDEIKRREMDRLRHLVAKQLELTNELDGNTGKLATNEHLDHANPHTFEIEDLKKLIKKTTSDLAVADQQRRDQFKEYEMQKEFEKNQKMEGMDEAQKKQYMEKMKQEEEAKKKHQPLHHPGSKPQLEEVWEKQDHMDQQFDPRAFFMTHDVDGNGMWDADEVKALFIKELDKLYGPNGPNKDPQERAEEMERMREHVFKENDRNHDGLIDFAEFMMETERSDFNRDEGWKSIDENQIYTPEEYMQFERQKLEEMRLLSERGLVDSLGRPIPGAQREIEELYQQQAHHSKQQPGYQQYQGHVPPHHSGGYNQGYQGQYPPEQAHGQAQFQQPPQYPPGHSQAQAQYQQPPQYPAGQPQAQAQYPQQAQYPPGQQQGQAQYKQPPQYQYQGQQPQQAQYQSQQPQQAQYQSQQPQQAQYQAQQQQRQQPQLGDSKVQQPPIVARNLNNPPPEKQPLIGQTPPARDQAQLPDELHGQAQGQKQAQGQGQPHGQDQAQGQNQGQAPPVQAQELASNKAPTP